MTGCGCSKQFGGALHAPLQYMDTRYSMPSAYSAGGNQTLPSPDTLARPALAATMGGRRKKNQSRRKRKLKGGFFAPSIMSPVISNFSYIAPAVALASYRYIDQLKSRPGGMSMKSLGFVSRRSSRKTKRRSSKR